MLSKPNAVWYLTRNGWQFFSAAFPKGLALVVPHDVINDLEVVNQTKLQEQIAAFIAQNKIKPANVVMVLADELLFTKILTALKPPEQTAELAHFLDEVPFAAEELVYELLTIDTKTNVIATNRALYQSIKTGVEAVSWRVVAVVPVVASGKPPTATTWPVVLTAAQELKSGNFLTVKPADSTAETARMGWWSRPRHRTIIGAAAMSSILIIIGALLMVPRVLRQRPPPALLPVAVTPAAVSVSAISTTTSPTAFDDTATVAVATSSTEADIIDQLKIQILNGSGIPGQAARLADTLRASGFHNITVGNTKKTSTLTTIAFSPVVPSTLQDRIIFAVKRYFDPITTAIGGQADFEVLIVTSKAAIVK